jgi:hypothetical protein
VFSIWFTSNRDRRLAHRLDRLPDRVSAVVQFMNAESS